MRLSGRFPSGERNPASVTHLWATPCYFRATAMARLGLVEAIFCCYFADSDADPPLW
jgi:hypothetical protein